MKAGASSSPPPWDLSQQLGFVLGAVFGDGTHFETESGERRLPGADRVQCLLAGRGKWHLSLENTIDPDPPGSAPSALSSPDNKSAPAPPCVTGAMHACRSQCNRDEDDVDGVEGFVEVVPEEAEGGGHQNREGNKCLR